MISCASLIASSIEMPFAIWIAAAEFRTTASRLDEISMSAPTTVCEVKDGEFLSYVITPEQFGFTRCSKDELIGGSPQDNAQIALAILKGEKGPRRDAVVLNSAAPAPLLSPY